MLTIIIINWNTGRLLNRCLASLAALPEKALIKRVIVVDNASGDDSIEQAKRVQGLPVQCMELRENIGFARANNIGLKELASDGNHVLLLNPDTEVQPGALQAMLDFLESHPKAGIVGPRLLNFSDRQTQPSVRSFPTLVVFIWLFLKLHRLLPNVSFWRKYMMTGFDYNKAAAVDQVMGAAFLIRDKAVEKLDERFWIWFEEVDFCKRAKAKGWEVWYTPSAQIIHRGAASFNQLVGFKRSWFFLRSSVQYANKHLGLLATSVLIILLPIALVLAVVSSPMQKRRING